MCDCKKLRNEENQKRDLTHRIVKLWDTAIDNRETGQQNKIDQSMDMTFFREIYSQWTFATIPRSFQIWYDVPQ